jgi:hypothetical protein
MRMIESQSSASSQARAPGTKGARPGAGLSFDLQAFLSAASRGEKVDESKRLAVQFLEKEIKTYIALALFLSKEGIKEHVQVGDKKVVISSTYYKERMREARKLVNELRKPS